MTKKLIIILIILAVVGVITSAVALHFMINSTPAVIGDQTPMLCWGTVKVDGVNAPIGTLVDIYIDELCGFPTAKYDDQVDSTTQFLNWIESRDEEERVVIYDVEQDFRGLLSDI